jgi:ABC-type transporter Mla subunit MlaD
MGEQVKNMLIGIFIIAACTLLVGIVMFLKPSVGDGKKTLYVRFSNINKIGIGTRVTYAGRPVGQAVAISEIPDPRKQPIDTLGRYYFYQLVLKVDSSVVVYNTDEIALQTSGLLGEKSIAIIPRCPPKGITPRVISHQPMYASSQWIPSRTPSWSSRTSPTRWKILLMRRPNGLKRMVTLLPVLYRTLEMQCIRSILLLAKSMKQV